VETIWVASSNIVTPGNDVDITPISAEIEGIEGTTYTETGTPNTAVAGEGGMMEVGGFDFTFIIMIAITIAAFYMLIFRPQRKREKEMAKLQSEISPGDSVITSSGMYGKVIEIGANAIVVEFGMNKGIRIPVNKTDIIAVREPDLTPPSTEA